MHYKEELTLNSWWFLDTDLRLTSGKMALDSPPALSGFVGGFCYILVILPDIGGRPVLPGTAAVQKPRLTCQGLALVDDWG